MQKMQDVQVTKSLLCTRVSLASCSNTLANSEDPDEMQHNAENTKNLPYICDFVIEGIPSSYQNQF